MPPEPEEPTEAIKQKPSSGGFIRHLQAFAQRLDVILIEFGLDDLATKGPAPARGRSDRKVSMLPHGFPESLRRVLESYVLDGNPTLDLAAELTGLSKRTLQRRLHTMGLTYSGLLDQVRYGIATRLMSDLSIRLVEVSQASGYDDPSHFSRAFRRLAGVTPSQYRRTEQGTCIEHETGDMTGIWGTRS